MGGRPEGRGTWNIKPRHGSSVQLWAMSCSGSLPGVEVVVTVAQVWKRPLSSLLFTLLGHTNPLPVRAGGDVFCRFIFGVTYATEGKVGLRGLSLTVFIRNREQQKSKHFGRWMQIMKSCWTVEQSWWCRLKMCQRPFWKHPKIITFGWDARLSSALGNWVEKQQTNRIYMTENLQKEAKSALCLWASWSVQTGAVWETPLISESAETIRAKPSPASSSFQVFHQPHISEVANRPSRLSFS